ncbi:MAG: efflux RND transporter periplasmic adaptor subunit [Muribaculaceae bacterium]
MKKITYALILLAVAACNSNKDSKSTDKEVAVVSKTVAKDTVKADAVTSATSKANQVSFNGTIEMAPQRMITISSTMGGVIKNTTIMPGQFIKKNSIVATVENPEFISLQQTFLDAHAQSEYLAAEYTRQKALSEEQAASQKKLQQSKAEYLSMKSRMDAASTQLRLLGVSSNTLLNKGIQPYFYIYATISGYVGDVQINVGKYMNAGDALCEIVDKNSAMLKLTAYEKDLASMKIDNPVQFRVNGMGDEVYNATLFTIGQKVDAISRSVVVYCKIKNSSSKFSPGMYVTARIMK